MTVRRSFHPILALLALASGCAEIPVDDGRLVPSGVLEGSVSYLGPRPACRYTDGEATELVGRVILFAYRDDNPPPPEGTATIPVSILAMRSDALFPDLESDCAPEGDVSPAGATIERVARFTWPGFALGTESERRYRVSGLFDLDGDFDPFFSVTSSPTAGDVVGGAFSGLDSASRVPEVIVFGSRQDHPHGQRLGGAMVSLDARMTTELPIFRLTSDPLSSEETIALTLDPTTNEAGMIAGTHTALVLYDDPNDEETERLEGALDAAALEATVGADPAYAFFVRSVDVDGEPGPDPHPLLGSASVGGYSWLEPITLIRRVKSDVEADAGIPEVFFLPALPSFETSESAAVVDGQVVFPRLPLVLPPIAMVSTNPDVSICQIGLLAPGAPTALHAALVTDCMELPTGRYATTVLQGTAAGELVPDAASPTGSNISGGVPAAQTWTVPNELGDPAELWAPGANPSGNGPPDDCGPSAPCAQEQGFDGAFVVHDPNPSTWTTRRAHDAACESGPNLFTGVDEPIYFADWTAAPVQDFVAANDEFSSTDEVAAACCAPVLHLCDVPLCAPVADSVDPTLTVRGVPEVLTEVAWIDGTTRFVPDCIPFPMPAPCCP